MAFSTETGGFGFAVPAPNLAQYSALAELKPLSLTGGGQSPIQIKPLAAWKVPDSHTEYVAEGIAGGMGAIAEGIKAAYKSKRDEQRDAEKENLKFQRDVQLALIKSDLPDPRLDEMIRHNQAMEENSRDRIDKVLPSEAKSLAPRSLQGIPSPTSSKGFRSGVSPIKTGLDFTKPLSEDQMGGQDSEQTGGKLNLLNNPHLTKSEGVNPAVYSTWDAIASKFAGLRNEGIWGDEAHQRRKSDHNTGDALDIGVPSKEVGAQIKDQLVAMSASQPIKYIIHNGQIWNSQQGWHPYHGADPHEGHVHVSFDRSQGGRSPLADLTSPQDIMEAAPEMRSNAALSALASIPWGQIGGQYKSASGGVPSSPVDAQSADWLRTPKSVTAPLAGMGGVSNEFFPAAEQALAEIPSYAGPEKNKEMEDAMGIDAIYGEQEALALRDYAKQTGRMEPSIKATQAGYEVKWPEAQVLESIAMRKDAAKARDEAAKQKEEEGKKGSKLQQDQMKIITNVEGARKTLKDITERLAQTSAGPVWGRVVGLNPYNKEAVAVENMVNSLVPSLARGVFGEVGVLTDRDVERYKALIPNMRTDPKVAKVILDDLTRKLESTKDINLDVWEKAGYDVSRFKESPKTEASSLDGEKSEMEALGKELRAVPDKDRKSYPDFEKKKARYIDLKEKLESDIYTDKNKGVIQEVKDSARSALSSLPLLPISIAGF